MLIDKINLNLLRIFEKVYETKSMTRASQELFMTQSGVSQNIKHLEEILDLKLFDRVKQRLLPTEKASILYENCKKNLRGIEQTLLQVTGKEEELMGSVSIGLPIEFGNNLVLPLLHELGEKYPKVTYRIKYGLGNSINKELLSGGLDFAFVDNFNFDKRIKLKKITDEALVMCASESYMKKIGPVINKKGFFEELDYLDYLPDAFVTRSWFKHHFNMSQLNLNLRASLFDVSGLSKMITLGMGVGVLPLYFVEALSKRGQKLVQFQGSGKPLQNAISVAWLEGKTRSAASEFLFNYLTTSF